MSRASAVELTLSHGGPSASGCTIGHDPEDILEPAQPISDPKVLNVAAKFRDVLEALELDRRDPNLRGTEFRAARAFRELFAGFYAGEEPELRTFPNPEGYAEMVAVTGIPFYSLCAHHFLPFFGMAHVAYLPGSRIVGLSKLARVVEFYARRPQVQERMTEQVIDFFDNRLAPAGAMVVVQARHLCMEMRGVGKPGLVTTTSAIRGAFADGRARQEFLSLVRGSPEAVPGAHAGPGPSLVTTPSTIRNVRGH